MRFVEMPPTLSPTRRRLLWLLCNVAVAAALAALPAAAVTVVPVAPDIVWSNASSWMPLFPCGDTIVTFANVSGPMLVLVDTSASVMTLELGDETRLEFVIGACGGWRA